VLRTSDIRPLGNTVQPSTLCSTTHDDHVSAVQRPLLLLHHLVSFVLHAEVAGRAERKRSNGGERAKKRLVVAMPRYRVLSIRVIVASASLRKLGTPTMVRTADAQDKVEVRSSFLLDMFLQLAEY
jgi:hypothetical protein